MKNFHVTKVLMILVIVLGGLYFVCPEYLRHAIVYQSANIDDHKIFNNRTVIANEYYPWKENPGFNTKPFPIQYQEAVDKYKTVAFLVIQKEKIIFEKYWDGYSAESRSNSFGMANSIISLMVGIAIDQGLIESLDQPIADFIPRFFEGDKSKITIRHLLEMSSGLAWKDSGNNPFSSTVKAYYGKDLNDLMNNLDLEKEPGSSFAYKSCDTQLLAMVLEKATGMSNSAFASQKLWRPMGASQDALWSLDELNGREKAFCCFNASARDFARFGQLILNDGVWNDREIISKRFLISALSPASHLMDENGKLLEYYGWNWWIHQHNGNTIYSMRGYRGQYVFVIPDKDIVIVRLGHKASKDRIDNVLPSDIKSWLDAGLEIAD